MGFYNRNRKGEIMETLVKLPKEFEATRKSVTNVAMNDEEWWWLHYYHHEIEPPKRYREKFMVLKGLYHRAYSLDYDRMLNGITF